jgi:hypothetical protein
MVTPPASTQAIAMSVCGKSFPLHNRGKSRIAASNADPPGDRRGVARQGRGDFAPRAFALGPDHRVRPELTCCQTDLRDWRPGSFIGLNLRPVPRALLDGGRSNRRILSLHLATPGMP